MKGTGMKDSPIIVGLDIGTTKITTVIGEAGREIATAENEAEAAEIIDEVCRILIRLAR